MTSREDRELAWREKKGGRREKRAMTQLMAGKPQPDVRSPLEGDRATHTNRMIVSN
jgi:hypothetical protein